MPGALGGAWPAWALGKVEFSTFILCVWTVLEPPHPPKTYARRLPSQFLCAGCGKTNMRLPTCMVLPGSVNVKARLAHNKKIKVAGGTRSPVGSHWLPCPPIAPVARELVDGIPMQKVRFCSKRSAILESRIHRRRSQNSSHDGNMAFYLNKSQLFDVKCLTGLPGRSPF